MAVDQRRSHRVRSHVQVDLIDKHGARSGTATDVARHGLFVAVADPPHNRHLVQLVLHIPGGPMQAAASVTRVLPGTGVGLGLFALSTEAKHRWDGFVQQVQRHAQQSGQLPGMQPTSLPMAPASPLTPPPPRAPSVPSFVVKLKTVARLRDYVTSHVAVGGTVLFTPVLPPAGSVVQLLVVHPETEAEFALGGRVHRAVTEAPKRLEIIFVDVDVAAFARFVETGVPPSLAAPPSLAPPPLVLSPPPAPSSSPAPNNKPSADLAVDMDVDMDFDIDDDASMEEEPIEWDLRTSDLPILMGRAVDSKPLVVVGETITHILSAAPEPDDDPLDELLIDDTVAAADLGLAPGKFELRCSSCDSAPYVVELGPCAGTLGLVADQVPYWSGDTGRVVSIPRLCSADVRRERFARFVGRGGAIDDVVNVAIFLAAADLAEAPRHPQSGETLRSSRAIERLASTARHAADDGRAHETRVRCPACPQGTLLLSAVDC